MEFSNNHENDVDDRIHVLDDLDVWSVIKRIALSGVQDDSFYICDVSDIIRKFYTWKATIPRVTTHYGK